MTVRHRGFTFIAFELAEDAAAATDNRNESELSERTIHVHLAKLIRMQEGSSRQFSQTKTLFSGRLLERIKRKGQGFPRQGGKASTEEAQPIPQGCGRQGHHITPVHPQSGGLAKHSGDTGARPPLARASSSNP